MNETLNNQNTYDDEIDLLDLLNTVLNGKWVILFFILISLLVAMTFAFTKMPVYKSEVLLLATIDDKVSGLTRYYIGEKSQTPIQAQIVILKSNRFINKVVADLELSIATELAYSNIFKLLYANISSSLEAQSIQVKQFDVGQNMLGRPLIVTVLGENTYELAFLGKKILKGRVGQIVKSSDGTIKVEISSLLAKKGAQFTITRKSKSRTIEDFLKQLKVSEKGKRSGVIEVSLEGENKEQIAKVLNHIANLAATEDNISLVSEAMVPRKPIKPKKALIIALGGLLGVMLGVMYVFVHKAFNQLIGTPENLESSTGIAVYTSIPFTKYAVAEKALKDKENQQKSLLLADSPADPAMEGVRVFRASLFSFLSKADNNIVMMTAPSPGVGTSFVSSNLAATMVASGRRVLLIDADLRKGYSHTLFDKNNSLGLSDLINKEAEIGDVIQTVKIENTTLDIITKGTKANSPSDLLVDGHFKKILDVLSSQYDVILIDTPPALAVTDAIIIGKHAGLAFMVLRSDKHTMKEVEYTLTKFSHAGIEIKGFVFNAYDAKKKVHGGYKYPSYYESYKDS